MKDPKRSAHSERVSVTVVEDGAQPVERGPAPVVAACPADVGYSERRFRQMVEALPAAVYTIDAAGRLMYFNPAAVELTGRRPEIGIDRWCVSWKLYRPDGAPLAHADSPMAITLRDGRAVRGEELIVERPNGTRVWCMPYPTPLLDAGGRVVGAINMLVDVSDRKHAEERLRDSERRFTRFMHNLPGLAWIKDLQGRYVYANGAAEDAFATALTELLGKTDEQVFPAATAAEFAANDRQVLDDDCSIQTIETLEHGDGTVHYSVVSKFPIPGQDGRPAMIGGVAIDVTELKQAEQALRRSEAWFRTLAEASPALIWRVDSDGHFTYVNPRFLEYCGRTEDELLNEGWLPLLHPDGAAGYIAAVDAAQRERTRLQAVVRVRHRDGTWRWIESYALPLSGDYGEYLGHVGTSLDVTERKQFEDALSEADSRKDEFLAMLAHELRNPLAPIRNSIEIMRRIAMPGHGGVQDPATAHGASPPRSPGAGALESVVQTLDRQVNQLVRLVDDLLDVSRISHGRIELRREQVDLASVVHHTVEAVLPLCNDMGQELIVTLPPHPVHVNADPARLAQIIGNLLSNACKFTGKGGRIWLTVAPDSASPPASVVIRVRDTGIGIASEQLSRIFDMFMQADTSLERAGSGLGIGLTLVKTLVDMHGGTVDVRSDGIGQGSEFIVRLPLSADVPAPAAPPPGDVHIKPVQRRILVVDDNRDSADSLAMLLRLSGHETMAVYDGLQAVDAASSFRPGVILMDIGLPKLNGFEAARRIRERQPQSDLLIVALTGWGQDSDRLASREAGFDAHLVKPVDELTLARLLAGYGDR
jgi:PAS domain S-box-containing protein